MYSPQSRTSLRHVPPRPKARENRAVRSFALSVLAALVFAMPAARSSSERLHQKSPHAEITAEARVETPPKRRLHKNRRQFEELDVTILSAQPVAEQDEGSDPGLPIDRSHRVHLVHDLTCGGEWVELAPGDRIEIKGEYVHLAGRADVIHFTHRADGNCRASRAHSSGYLRRASMAGATAPETKTFSSEDLFTTALRPVLARRCVCHEKGGKMYELLPFDDPTVIASHADGVRRRFKGEDLATLERWLATRRERSAPDLAAPPTPGSAKGPRPGV
jgi:hypothetical protein